MTQLTRLRIVLFAVAIFGAFANFAQNTWGDTVIICCQIGLALTFFAEMSFYYLLRIRRHQLRLFNMIQFTLLFSTYFFFPAVIYLFRIDSEKAGIVWGAFLLLSLLLMITDSIVFAFRKRNNLDYTAGILENFALFLCMYGLFAKNLRWPGSVFFFSIGVLVLAIFYARETFNFLRGNFARGRGISIVLTLGSFSAIFMGLWLLFKLMHYPGKETLFVAASGLFVLMLVGSMRWKYPYDGEYLNVFQALKLFRNHIVIVYFAVITCFVYWFMQSQGWAPAFYSQRYPSSYNALTLEGKVKEAKEVADVYNRFVEHCRKSGFEE